MASITFLILAIILSSRTSGATSRGGLFEASAATDKHEQWMSRFHRVYSDESEKTNRFEIFKKNLEFVKNFNMNTNITFKLDVNQFSDLTDEEFRARYMVLVVPEGMTSINSEKTLSYRYEDVSETGESMDWREGAVTSIKYQGQCGLNDEEALLNAVSQQPVSTVIDGPGYAFKYYSGGVFDGECGTEMSHAVAIVGYGISEERTKYWLVKNSWGESWGENGYMRIKRDVDAPEGMCVPQSGIPGIHHSTFESLRLGQSSQSIAVGLIRFWDSLNFKKDTEFLGITVIFLDEKVNSVIHGLISAGQANHCRLSLKAGSIVKVVRFEVARALTSPKKQIESLSISSLTPMLGSRALFCGRIWNHSLFPKRSGNFRASFRTKRVGTHNGTFHCDETLACFMLRLSSRFSGAQIVRTRDHQVLEKLDAALDVGGVYDPESERYDHHQKGFTEVFGHGFNTKLSSAGLIYKHYGLEIIAKELQLDQKHTDVQRLFLAVYKNFIEVIFLAFERDWQILLSSSISGLTKKDIAAVDAIDNGIHQYDTDQPPRYVNNTSLAHRIGRLNLDWIEPDQSSSKEDEAFHRAMELAGSEFLQCVHFHAKSWLPARSIVMECLAERHDVDSSGEIMKLNKQCPWKLHIFELEEEMKIDPPIKYVLYQDDRSENWRIQAVSVSPDKFESRKALPISWRGLEKEQLSEESSIPGCVFVHMSGFIGANRSYEGALAMAKASLVA
ncbi:hypothetical protein YC2023_040804 [Brassica napus]